MWVVFSNLNCYYDYWSVKNNNYLYRFRTQRVMTIAYMSCEFMTQYNQNMCTLFCG